jgi:hypothetical protein
MRGRGTSVTRKSLCDNKTEGTGFEPVRACARRFSRRSLRYAA